MKIKQSFAFKLSFYIILSVIVVFVTVLFYNFFILKELIFENNKENISNLKKSTLNEVQIYLESAIKVAQQLSFTLETANLDELQIKALLEKSVSANAEIYGSAIAFSKYSYSDNLEYFSPYVYKKENTLQYKDLIENKYDYIDMPWYKRAAEAEKPLWSEPYFDEGGGNCLMVTYSVPFFRNIYGERKFSGVVTCDIKLDWLVRMVGKIKVFNTGFAFIVSSKGIFIAHPEKDYYSSGFSMFTIAELYNDSIEADIGKKMIAGNSGHIRYYSRYLRRNAYIFFQPLDSTGWSMGVVVPENELFSKLNAVTYELLFIGLAGYIFTLGLIIYLSTRATVPLKKLAEAAYKIQNGDLKAELPVLKSQDEVGILSSSFKSMQSSIIEYIERLKETATDLAITQEITIECMASVAEFRDPETGFHIRRTQMYVKELAQQLRTHPKFKDYLDDSTIYMLYLSAPLHDIGKVAIPDSILLKPGRLSDNEFEIMKKHPIYGRDAIAGAEKKLKKLSFLRFARDIASTHHEKFDGSGYPFGLKGDDIPIAGRLMALADVYDALVTKRIYKQAFTHAEAKAVIIQGRGSHFDPDVVDAFLAIEDTFKKIASLLMDKADPVKDNSIQTYAEMA